MIRSSSVGVGGVELMDIIDNPKGAVVIVIWADPYPSSEGSVEVDPFSVVNSQFPTCTSIPTSAPINSAISGTRSSNAQRRPGRCALSC
jgi:hypothetical protein